MTFLDPSAYVGNSVDSYTSVDSYVQSLFSVPIGETIVGGHKQAFCRILMGGFDVGTWTDVTDAVTPHLISVHINDEIEQHTCDIELDDRYGSLPIPPLNSPCVVVLGWVDQEGEECFWGHIQDIEHGCARGENAGRRLWIHAKGENFNSPGKENQQDHLGEGAPPGESEGEQIPMTAAIGKFTGAAAHSAVVNQAIDAIKRDYWSIDNESMLNWSSRITEELGLLFRVTHGTQAEYTVPGQRADGAMRVLQADWGRNMIGWRVHPAAARPAWNESKQQFFDTRKAIWKGLTSSINSFLPGGASSAGYQGAGPAASEGVADQQAVGTGNFINYSMEPGRVVIVGDPTAHAGYYVRINGARPGVDGVWWVFGVEHLYSRSGYITWLNVKYPTVQDLGAIVQAQLNDLGMPDMIEQNAAMAQAYSVDPNFLTGLIANSPGFTVSLQQLKNTYSLSGLQNMTPAQISALTNAMSPLEQQQFQDFIKGLTPGF